jgi:hypothetical protein
MSQLRAISSRNGNYHPDAFDSTVMVRKNIFELEDSFLFVTVIRSSCDAGHFPFPYSTFLNGILAELKYYISQYLDVEFRKLFSF